MTGLTLYDCLESGNGHKVRLLLSLLGIDYKLVLLNIREGETRTPAFLRINPNGKIPVLQLDDGRTLTESNAILYFLAEGTSYLPADSFQRAQVLSWTYFEQYQHEPNIAVARSWLHHLQMTPERQRLLAEKQENGRKVLSLMDMNFSHAEWAVGTAPTIADICLFSYTSVADESGLDLAPYAGVRRWLDRVSALPGFIPMDRGH